MKLAYFDCSAGAAGDMILGALLDAGASEEFVIAQLGALNLEAWNLETTTVTKAGLRATRVLTNWDEAPDRDHADIVRLLTEAPLDEHVKDLSLRTFDSLAEAEARVHATTKERVHFHEVGALDSIIDTVGACAAFASLGIERAVCSPIAVGRGVADTRHGPMPVPVPAVTELLRDAPIVGHGEFETVTPTGAALLVSFADDFGDMPSMTLEATGYGAGLRETSYPNVVRVMVGTASEISDDERLLLAETNIDDMSPELVPYVIEQLLTAGARDAWAVPVTMKKGRNAIAMSVLFDPDDEDRILDVLFRETTTFGVRIGGVRRRTLERDWVETEVEGHVVRVKVGRRSGEIVTAAPEYEDAAHAARATGLPLKEVYARALRSAEIKLEESAPQLP